MPRVSKSKSKLKGKAAPSKKKSAFILTGEHKLFLTKRADEHAEASQQEKLKIVALAIQELLAEYSITCKEDIRKADKVIRTWFYDRNDRGESVVPITKFGIVKEMTAKRLWSYENKQFITDTVRETVPSGPSDPQWIGEYSRRSAALWQAACKDSSTVQEYEDKADKFKEGKASLAIKASYGDHCFADFCRTVVNYSWKVFGATSVILTSRPTHTTVDGSSLITVFDKDPENPHRIAFTETQPNNNWNCNSFVKFTKGRIPSEDGISRKAWVVFHRSGEPMLPEWNSETPVKVKRDILLHFLRINFVMATGISSSHPPYKRMIDGNISDYICSDHIPKMVHDEPFALRKPGDMKIAHLDAWLNLLRDRQEKYLRREVDEIFRFACTKAGPIPKPAIYDTDFMKAYALEHGPMYELSPSQSAPPTVNLVNPVNELPGRHEANVGNLSAEARPPILDETPPDTRQPSSGSNKVPSETASSNSNPTPSVINDTESPDYGEDDQQVDNYLLFECDDTGDSSERESRRSGVDETQSSGGGRIHDAEIPSSVASQDDDLEQTLQELESPHSAKLDDAVNKYVPRWAGGLQAKRIAFLKRLSRNPNYQGILAELEQSKHQPTHRSHFLPWSSWDSDKFYLPREAHIDRDITTQFMKFLLSSKKNVFSIVADLDQTEEFLLTVGLAYRDMTTIHLGRDPTDPRPEPPEYMDVKNTLLSQRILDVCDSILIVVYTEMKLYKEKSGAVITTKAVKGRQVAATKSSSLEPGTSSESDQDTATATGSNRASRVRDDSIPIILARPRPRKRPRTKSIAEFEEEETFIIKRSRIQPGEAVSEIRKSSRPHAPKRISDDFEATMPIMNRRNR